MPEFGLFLDWGKDLDWWMQATASTKVTKKSLLTLGGA